MRSWRLENQPAHFKGVTTARGFAPYGRSTSVCVSDPNENAMWGNYSDYSFASYRNGFNEYSSFFSMNGSGKFNGLGWDCQSCVIGASSCD